ncbi:MAG: nitrile hydratase subunit alpha [Holophagales bacterium]|nr:nitrile hydratase subunit alpha [Holophagales bacterium]MYH25319.1 nitrile hydratase subunit alpha [Holophagales bacterium]
MTADHRHGSESPETRTEAIEALLVGKGLVKSAAVDALVERYEQDIGPLRGARVVAKAWTDPKFRARLLEDGMPAIRELGFGDNTDAHVARLVVKENTESVHNLVVCTLCSCYPWAVLGLPPAWYKSPAYRSRAVREPRRLLAELGLDLSPDVEVRVWDSSAEVRYMVLPQRPEGTDGLGAEELTDLVTRDSMIGVERLQRTG